MPDSSVHSGYDSATANTPSPTYCLLSCSESFYLFDWCLYCAAIYYRLSILSHSAVWRCLDVHYLSFGVCSRLFRPGRRLHLDMLHHDYLNLCYRHGCATPHWSSYLLIDHSVHIRRLAEVLRVCAWMSDSDLCFAVQAGQSPADAPSWVQSTVPYSPAALWLLCAKTLNGSPSKRLWPSSGW